MKLSWCPDLTAESNLRRLGVVFDVGNVAFSKLDLKESQVNGARLGDPLVQSLISDYRQGMLNGDTFPRIVVHPGKAGWIILSGNQRTAAVEKLVKEGELPKDPQIECYKLDECDKLLREIIARSANVVHGGRAEYDERLAHAVYCCRALGMSPADAAKTFCVGKDGIIKNMRAEKERDSLMRSGVDASRLPITTLDAISKLPFDTNAKQQVAILTVDVQRITAERDAARARGTELTACMHELSELREKLNAAEKLRTEAELKLAAIVAGQSPLSAAPAPETPALTPMEKARKTARI
jgi:hypothetical protein